LPINGTPLPINGNPSLINGTPSPINGTPSPTENGTPSPTENGTPSPTKNGTSLPIRNGTSFPIRNGTPSCLSDITGGPDFSLFEETICTPSEIATLFSSGSINATVAADSSSNWIEQILSSPSPSSISPHGSSDNSIETFCHYQGISTDLIAKAKYLSDAKSLIKMAWNHRAMVKILMVLMLHGRVTDNFIPSKTITLPDKTVLQAEAVVKKFGWSAESFKHKCAWYGWAETVARSKTWKGSIPGMYPHLFLICNIISH
jgi:hypothetical protein